MRFKDLDFFDVVLLGLIVFSLVIILSAIIYSSKGPKCEVYSEEKVKHGFMYVGKVYVPTTYMGRDCLIYEDRSK